MIRFEYVETIDSTNNELKRRLENGAPPEEYTVLSAGTQTAGRGRAGHVWTSPRNVSVSTSMILYPDGLRDEVIPRLTILAAIAVAETVERLYGLPAQIKWVNDVLLSEKKLSGILTERVAGGARTAVIVGIGINVHPGSYPEELREVATCLDEELWKRGDGATPHGRAQGEGGFASGGARGGEEILNAGARDGANSLRDGAQEQETIPLRANRREVVETLWNRFISLYEQFCICSDVSFVLDDYNRRLINAGRTVRIASAGKDTAYTATALAMDAQGRLVVRRDDGTIEAVDSGEVHVRGVYGYV